jgi:membrane-associated phospholipid phosphatase
MTSARLERATWIAIVALCGVYLALFLAGTRFLVLKTAVLPLILAYGLLVRHRAAFMADWLPLLAATILFDAVRGAIYTVIERGYIIYYVAYVVKLEEAVFGVAALPVPVQAALRSPALDTVTVLVHASHFMFFLLFGLVLWQVRREHFRVFRRSLVLLMLFGLIGYAVIPTAPPWLAARSTDLMPALVFITEAQYTAVMPELYGTFATNPVAAMPSLHVAFPTVCAIVGWRAYGRRAGLLFSVYALLVAFSVVYLGEHYGVDVIAGLLVAVLAAELGRRMQPLGLSFQATMALSAAGVALTYLIAGMSGFLPPATF